MADDELLRVLTRFHREVVLPDVKQAVDESINTAIGSLRDEMYTLIDGIYARFDRHDSEFAAIIAAVKRLEARIGSVATREDVDDLREQLERVNERIAHLEEQITAS